MTSGCSITATASNCLPPALQASGDDVATKDYPAAVSKVLELTGAKTVQMVVHCWGSTTFFMAMLAGLKGVRSAVASQIATQIRAPFATHLKTGLHLPSFLKAIGIDNLTAYVDNHEGVAGQGLRCRPEALPAGAQESLHQRHLPSHYLYVCAAV